MKANELLYKDAKAKLCELNRKKLISENQLDFLLILAREKLGLFVIDKSIYL